MFAGKGHYCHYCQDDTALLPPPSGEIVNMTNVMLPPAILLPCSVLQCAVTLQHFAALIEHYNSFTFKIEMPLADGLSFLITVFEFLSCATCAYLLSAAMSPYEAEAEARPCVMSSQLYSASQSARHLAGVENGDGAPSAQVDTVASAASAPWAAHKGVIL